MAHEIHPIKCGEEEGGMRDVGSLEVSRAESLPLGKYEIDTVYEEAKCR